MQVATKWVIFLENQGPYYLLSYQQWDLCSGKLCFCKIKLSHFTRTQSQWKKWWVMSYEVVPLLPEKWKLGNSKFSSPIIIKEEAIVTALMKYWPEDHDHSYKKMPKSKQQSFLKRLDKIMDLLKCKCIISTSQESNCDGYKCKSMAHILAPVSKTKRYFHLSWHSFWPREKKLLT